MNDAWKAYRLNQKHQKQRMVEAEMERLAARACVHSAIHFLHIAIRLTLIWRTYCTNIPTSIALFRRSI